MAARSRPAGPLPGRLPPGDDEALGDPVGPRGVERLLALARRHAVEDGPEAALPRQVERRLAERDPIKAAEHRLGRSAHAATVPDRLSD
jgi:hypothetical protein